MSHIVTISCDVTLFLIFATLYLTVLLYFEFATLCDWSYLWLNILWCDSIPSICDFTLHRVAIYLAMWCYLTYLRLWLYVIISHYHIMTFMTLFLIFAILHLIMWLLYISQMWLFLLLLYFSQCDFISCISTLYLTMWPVCLSKSFYF